MVIEAFDAKISPWRRRIGEMDDRVAELREFSGEIRNGCFGSANRTQIWRFHRVVDDGAMDKNDTQF